MGKVSIITKDQEVLLAKIAQNDWLKGNFYFSGGTALSAVYLQHRLSEDLDFFSFEEYDSQVLLTLMEQFSHEENFTFQAQKIEVINRFDISFGQSNFKVDFAHYPFRQLEPAGELMGVKVDSLLDIAVNKMLTISQRTDVKDFVDLYFLADQVSFFDLIAGVKKKFNFELDPLLLASDFLKVEDFDFLPKMVKPLTIDDLKSFFREKAKEVGYTKTV